MNRIKSECPFCSALSARKVWVALAAMVGVLPVVTFATSPAPGVLTRCKYSVRDVAFVNVHGKDWQLELIKPDGLAESDFENWNQVLKGQLSSSNVGFIWHREGTQPSGNLKAAGTVNVKPEMYLTSANGDVIPVPYTDDKFDVRINKFVHSPVREKLLDRLTESLCVFLLVRGDNSHENVSARNTLDAAVNLVEKQMWMMEKASDKGPAIVECDANDPRELITLHSIGIDPETANNLPVVAIVFGQARRLGDVLSRDQIETKRLVSLASICGRDCECELDRQWLYGQQMVHAWTSEHERSAEKSLDFDPHSAFVIAEVSQILQKRGRQTTGAEHVNLGAGLVIHDLDALDTNASSEPEAGAEAETVAPAETGDSTDGMQQAERPVVENASSSNVPWILFVGLGVAAVVMVLFRMAKTRVETP